MSFSRTSYWMAFSLISISPHLAIAAPRSQCRYEAQNEAQAALQVLKQKFSTAVETHGFFDTISAHEGCARALNEQSNTRIQRFETLIKATKFPPDPEACVQLTMSHDQAQSWLFQYELIRQPHVAGTPRTPEVCVTGKLRISYDDACKQPDRAPNFGITVQNQTILDQANTSAQIANKTKANTKPSGIVLNRPQPKLLNRKAVGEKEQALVEAAAASIKEGKITKLSPLSSMGELLVHSELNDSDKKNYPSSIHSDFLENWQSQVEEYKRLYAETAGHPIEERLETLYRTINKDFTRKYNHNDAAFWNRPDTRLIDLLEGEGANCQGAAKMNLAMIAAVVGDELPEHLVPAAQITKGHVEAVIYNTQNKTVWATRSGGPAVPYKEGELYHPAILLRADLFSHHQKTIAENELLLARPDTPPVSKSTQDLAADKNGSMGTPEMRALPWSEYGEFQKNPRYDVVLFHDSNESVTSTAYSAAPPSFNIEKDPDARPASKDRYGSMDFLLPGTELQVWETDKRADGQDFTFVASSSGDINYNATVFFNERQDRNDYAKLKTIQEKKDFFIGRAKQRSKEVADYLNNEGAALLLDPSKWKDKNAIDRLDHEMNKLRFVRRTLNDLGENLKNYGAYNDTSKRLTEIYETTKKLAHDRPEVILRALHQASDHATDMFGIWNEMDTKRQALTYPIQEELIAALNKMPEVRIGRNANDPFQSGEIVREKPEPAQQSNSQQAVSPDGKVPVSLPKIPPKVKRVSRKADPSRPGGGFSARTLLALIYNKRTSLKKPWKFTEVGLTELREALLDPYVYSAQTVMAEVKNYLVLLKDNNQDDPVLRNFLKDICTTLKTDSDTAQVFKSSFCK